ncbi:glycosyltransferase [Helicobacter heilmannii]|uniref:glycosyltransferase n=1 Tax=Helicobacter heilmannii TaxID=35817 RepID=UPI0009E68241|nr:glycosyltransferase [Helicobacter heilmannii]
MRVFATIGQFFTKENPLSPHVPIAMAFDKNYLIPAAVAIYSLLECLQKSKDMGKEATYTIHIFYSGLQELDMQKLAEMAKPYAAFIALDFIGIDGFLEKFKDVFDKAFIARFSKMILMKYLLVDLFPQYDKIIWSDVDVLFLQDPTDDFIQLDISQPVYLHAVFVDEIDHALEGFWFCNLAYMRAHNWTQKVLECIQKRQGYLKEMELIAFVWQQQEIAQLSFKYCVFPSQYEGECLCNLHPLDVPRIQEILDHPTILHYYDHLGSPKPWEFFIGPKVGLWLSVLCKTSFAQDFFLEYDARSKQRQADLTEKMATDYYFSYKFSTLHLIFKTPCRFLCAYYKAVKHRLFSRGVLDLARRVRYKILGGGGVKHPHFHPSHTPHNPDLFSKLKG